MEESVKELRRFQLFMLTILQYTKSVLRIKLFLVNRDRLSQEIESVCILGNENNTNIKGTKFHEIFNTIVVYKVR